MTPPPSSSPGPTPAPPAPPPPEPPHDDERCAVIYQRCKPGSVGFARRLLGGVGGRANRHLCAFDAEDLYDAAWETYYNRREYLEDRDNHVAHLNALILCRFRDEARRSTARKRTAPGRVVDLDIRAAETLGAGTAATQRPGTRRQVSAGADEIDDRVVDRHELRQLLAQVRNPDDARALLDHEVRGMTYQEIAEREGISAEAARRRAQRARSQARGSAGSEDRRP